MNTMNRPSKRLALGLTAIALAGGAFAQVKPTKPLQTASAGQSAGVDKQYQSAVDAAYAKYKDLKEGKNADYIPALAQVPSDLFGVSLVSVDGHQQGLRPGPRDRG
jgi:glutaminase